MKILRNFYVIALFLLFANASFAAFTVNIISPSNDTTTSDSTPEISFNVSGDNTTYDYAVWINGVIDGSVVNAGNASSETVIARNLSTLNEGTHTFLVEGRNETDDTQSFVNSTLLTITVDLIPVLDIQINSTPDFFNIGNLSQNYTLRVNITSTGGNATGITVTFYVPWGIENNTACEGGFAQLNITTMSCIKSYGDIGVNGIIMANLSVTANISAFTTYGSTGQQPFIFLANCTDLNGCSLNTTNAALTARNFFRNPRPDVAGVPENLTIFFTEWQQSEPEYKAQVPIYSWDSVLERPVLANRAFGDIFYFDKSEFEFPSFIKIFSYNLTFRATFSTWDNTTFIIRSPIDNTQNPNQGLIPLLISTINSTDYISNDTRNFTSGFPDGFGFTVYVNRSIAYTKSLLEAQGVNITFSDTEQEQNLLIVNITNPGFANNTEFTVQLTLANNTACSSGGTCLRSPVYLYNQTVTTDFFEAAPPFGQTVDFNFTINASNLLNNFTLSNLKLSFMIPMNVTMNNSGTIKQFNMTENVSILVFDGTNWNSNGFVRNNSIVSFEDKEFSGGNVTIYTSTWDVDLTNTSISAFGGWEPGTYTSALVNFSAAVTFPVLNEVNNTPGTLGSSNQYNATVQISQRSAVNLTTKVPGINPTNCPTAAACSINITLNGVPVSSANFTIGSLVLKDISAGTNALSVSYALPSATPTPTPAPSSGGGGGSGGGGAIIVDKTPKSSHIISKLSPGAAVSVNVNKTEIGIKFVTIEVKNQANDVKITITKHDSKPASVTKEIGKKVYQYLEIEHENLIDTNIQSSKIKFSVSKNWLANNSVNKNDIVLSRYKLGNWNELETLLVSEDSEEATYEAASPGLSVFAITFKEAAPTPVPTPTPITIATPVPTATPVPKPVPKESKDWSLAIYIAVLVVLAGAYIFYKNFSSPKLRSSRR
jgi:PGF-pre-PGF domain-containing protein